MFKKLFNLTLTGFIISVLLLLPSFVSAGELEDKQAEIEQLEQKISQLQGQQKTLSSTIIFLDTRIALTQTQIAKTQVELKALEADIATLSGKIDKLNLSLNSLTELLLNRISTTYKRISVNPVTLFFSSEGFSEFLTRIQYLRLVQRHDRRIIFATEQARANYDAQKDLKETKQAEVEALNDTLIAQKASLARQQTQKQQLLSETKNSEKNYQQKLAAAVAELTAIQGIIAGRGQETKVKDVNEGEKIASILRSGPNLYACSSGPHLHFEVAKDNSNQNPFNFLQPKSLSWNNIDPPQNGTGSWRWPLNDPIGINQGYGNTSYSSRYAGNKHTGVDMVGGNYDVFAVKKGTLYRGGISCAGGTLQYVRVDHSENEYDTYYLHVNYI